MASTPKTEQSRIHHYLNTSFQLLLLIAAAFLIRTFLYGLYQVPTGSMETTLLVGERFLADKLTIWYKPLKHGEIISFNDPNYEYSENSVKNWFERYVYGPSNWTKRVIGIPGDHIEGKIEDGKPVVYRNGKKLDEPYVNKYPIIALWQHKPSSELMLKQGGSGYNFWSFDPAVPFNNQPFYRIDTDRIIRQYGEPYIRYPHTPHPNNEDIFDVTLAKDEYWVMGDNRLGSWDSRGWGKLDGKLIHGRIIFRIWSIDSTEDWWIVDLIKHPIDFWKRMRWSRWFQTVQ
jgi:signal peptidase I